MNGGPCLHWDCSNRNSFGYCRTTACINEQYQQEQWGLSLTTNKSESVVKQPKQTNADRIRAMTDEELAVFLNSIDHEFCAGDYYVSGKYVECWEDWLKQEVEE